jgi:hypothetical protein
MGLLLFWKTDVKLIEMSVNEINIYIYIVLHILTAQTPCLRDDVKHSSEGSESK